MAVPGFTTKVFEKVSKTMADHTEDIVVGGRDKMHLLPKAFEGVKQIGVIGWSSQGPAQSQNLRDSLEGTGIRVKVGLREGSASMKQAEEKGFTKANGTLGDMWEVIAESDMVCLLIADAAQVEIHKEVFKKMKKGATLGLSHGFLLGHLKSKGEYFPSHIDVVAVCPKGMGPSVRRLYEQGKTVNGAGINCSMAVEQDITGMATERAIGWGIGVGAPFIFKTTLESEFISDIFGERGILLGAAHGIIEFLYRHFLKHGASKEDAFKRAAEGITGPISKGISHAGLLSVYEGLDAAGKKEFEAAYSAAYHPSMEVLREIYDEVASGREISSVVDHVKRFKDYPMGEVDITETWTVGKAVRATRPFDLTVDPTTAGVYLACMTAQCDLLMNAGHSYSEVANESIIEGVDSLNPYMHHRGVAFMIDNCSITARLGARKWAARFDYLLTQQAGPKLDNKATVDQALIDTFKSHKIHKVMEVCCSLRPPVDISLQV